MKKVKNFVLKFKQKCRNVWRNYRDVSEEITYDDFFDYPLEFLKFISYDFSLVSCTENWKEKLKIISKNLIMWLHLINCFIYVSFMAIESMLKRHNYKEVIFAVIMFNLWSVLFVKMSRYFWIKQEVHDLKNSLKSFYPKLFNSLARKYLQYFRILRLAVTITYVSCSSFFALIPIIVYMIYDEIITPLPFVTTFFDTSNMLVYPFIYIWEQIVVYQALLIHFAFDLMTMSLICAISQEWSQLGQDFGD